MLLSTVYFAFFNITELHRGLSALGGISPLWISVYSTSRLGFQNSLHMENMFACCSSLTSLDISGFDTSNVYSMSSMFEGCIRLTTLDQSAFDTSNVKYIGYMFYGCSELTSLDLSGFDTRKVTEISQIGNNSFRTNLIPFGRYFLAEK